MAGNKKVQALNKKYRSPSIAEARVYRELKQAILSGVFEPGFLLIQEDLCRQFRVSRTPIRDALTHLQAEGLVVAMPNKGVFVRELNVKDVHELYELRLLLESAAAKDAAGKADKRKLSEILEDLQQLSQKRNVSFDRLREMGTKLHSFIVASSGNNMMRDILDQVGVLIELSRTPFRGSRERFDQINREHVEIIKAILNGKGEMAADLMRTHLTLNREAHLKLLLGSAYELVGMSQRSARGG